MPSRCWTKPGSASSQNDAYGVASTLLALGWAAADRQDGATAAANYAESLALWQELGTQEGVVDVLAGVAELAGTARQPERADPAPRGRRGAWGDHWLRSHLPRTRAV